MILFHPFLIYLLTYLYQYGLYKFLFQFIKLSQICPMRAISSWLKCPFDIFSYFINNSFLYKTRCSRLTLQFPCHSSTLSNFCKEPQLLLGGCSVWQLISKTQVCSLLQGELYFQDFSVARAAKHAYIFLFSHNFLSISLY